MRKFIHTMRILSVIAFCFSVSLVQAQTSVFNYTGTAQTYTVPAGVTSISIEAKGAQGGGSTVASGGRGAILKGDFVVTPGQVIRVLVGQQAPTTRSGSHVGGGGGGGTFVVNQSNNQPLVVAGGGGGAAGQCCGVIHNGVNAVITTNGTAGLNASGGTGAGGVNGNGGAVGSSSQSSGAGGGFLTDGANGNGGATGGKSYLNGGAGGLNSNSNNGGFGGGGGSHSGAGGGGGGYSGGGSTGGGGQWGGGGGGGSINNGTNQVNSAGVQTGNGSVTITVLNTPAGALNLVKASNTYVTIPHSASLNLGAEFTIESWVNYTGTNNTIIDKGDYNYLLQVNCSNPGFAPNRLNFYNRNTGWVNSTGTVPEGVWTHVAVTLKNGTMTFYINGVASGTAPVNFAQDNGPVNIGRQAPSNCACNIFNGSIDELRLWNRALSSCEISANRSCQLTGAQTGLAAYYQFNQGSVGANNSAINTLTDASGNNNTGTLTNFALTGTTSNWVAGQVSGTCAAYVTPTAAITGTLNACRGNTSQLSNSITGGTWSSSNTSVATVNASGLVTALATGTTNISYTNSCGGVSTTTFTVNAIPTATITAGEQTTFCAGGSVTLTATGGASYLWSNGSTASSITVTAAGTYSVVATTSGCASAAASTTVTVNAIPTASISASGPTTFCAGGSVTLTATGGVSYLWSNGSTASSITVTAAGTYSVVATSAEGCTSAAATTTVTVNALPTAAISANGPTTFCAGGSVTLNGVGLQNIPGNSLSFNGINNSVRIPDVNYAGVNSFTIEAWIRPNNITSNPYYEIARQQGAPNWIFSFQDYGTILSFGLNTTTGYTELDVPITASSYTDGNWHHVAATYDGTNCRIYRDGVLIGSNNKTGNIVFETEYGLTTYIGAYEGGEYFNGLIDEVRFWNITRTQLQLQAAMSMTLPDNTAGMTAYYKFDEGTSTTTNDASGNGNHGTLTNGTSWSPLSPLSANSNLTYLWSPGGATTSSITTSIAGTYTLQVTSSDGCTATSAPVEVIVNALPTATITADGPTTLCPGGSVTLTASAGSSYLWSTGATTQSITVSNTGSYTVTVTNASNCSATSAATVVTVQDNIAPVTPTLPTITAACSATAPVATTTDNCAGTISGTTSDPLTYNTQGTYTIHWTFNDGNGNSTTANQQVVISDVTPPTIVCPANISVNATSAAGAVVNYTTPVGTDNCAGVVTTLTAGVASGSTFPIGNTTITYTARDAAGNTTTCSFTVTVAGLAPVIVCPSNITVNNTTGQCGANVSFAATETTGIPASTITYSHAPGSFFPIGTTTVTATATNAVGTTICSFTVTVVDNQPPVLACANNGGGIGNLMRGITSGGTASVVGWAGINGALQYAGTSIGSNCSENWRPLGTLCDEAPNTNSQTISTKTNNNSGATWSSAGGAGIGVLVVDLGSVNSFNLAKVFQMFSDGKTTSIQGFYHPNTTSTAPHYNDAGWIQMFPETAVGAGVLSGNNVSSPTSVVFAPTSSRYVRFYLKNNGSLGNGTWIETRSIKLFNSSDIVTNVDPASCSAVVNYSIPVTDNCPGTVVTYSHPSGSVFPVGTTVVNVLATDASGNTSTCSFNVTVVDNQAPVITCPANMNVIATSAAGAVVNYTAPVGTDNCASTTTRTAGLASGSTFPLGTTTVTYSVTDAAGNTAQCSFTVTVAGLAPVIVCPSNITVNNAPGQCGANVSFAATETTAIPASTITYSHAPGSFFPVGTTTVTATATNAVGTRSCSFTVTVVDNQVPVITTNGNQSVNNDPGQCDAIVLTTASATDNCSVGAPIGVRSDAQPLNAPYPVGTTTITWNVTDMNGNVAAEVIQTVIVTDNQAPTAVAQNLTINLNANGTASITAAQVNNGSSDNCGVATIAIDKTSFDCSNVGANTVTLTVTDVNGNVSTATAVVTVVDNISPTITEPANISQGTDAGICGATVNLGTPVTADNCAVATITNNAPVLFPVGTTIVTWIVTDVNGNSSTATQTVVIADTEKPRITAPGLVSVVNAPGTCSATVNLGTPVTSDNCEVATVTNNAPALFPVGTTIVTWTVTDIHGNVTDTATQTVVVIDNELPTISVNNISVNNDAGKCGATVMINMPATADNCGVATVMGERSDNKLLTEDYPVGTTTINWTVRDINGNSRSTTQTIIVRDNEKPTIVCAANQVFCANTGGNTQYNIPVLNQSDNCGIASTTYSITGATNRTGTGTNASGSFAIGTSTVTFTVTDIHGNVSTCSFTVRINPLPVASITAASANALCNQFTLTGNSTLSGTYSYQWLYNSTTKATTQQLSLGLTDADGVYSLYTTDANGCRSELPATYTYQKQNLVSSYTILGIKEVKLGQYNKVETGSVGVMSSRGEADFDKYSSVTGAGSFVKAPRIDTDKGVTINSKIYGVATVTLPAMQYNTSNTRYLSDVTVNSNTTTTLNGNYDDVTVKKGANVTLTGTIFGKIKLEEGANVRFTASTIDLEELQIEKGPKSGGYSYIRFAPNTSVRVSKKVTIGSDVIVNPESYQVTFYMGDNRRDEEKFHVKGDDTRITANIILPNGKLKVTGVNYGDDRCDHRPHGYKDCRHRGHGHHDCDHRGHSDRDCRDDVFMTGLFIAEEVESEGKNVIWNNYNCSAPAAPVTTLASNNSQATVTEGKTVSNKLQATSSTEEELKVTVMPNPSTTYFTLKLESKYDAPVTLRVIDGSGRVVDSRAKIGSNSTIQIGHNYHTGNYFAELIQGTRRKVIQLIKVR